MPDLSEYTDDELVRELVERGGDTDGLLTNWVLTSKWATEDDTTTTLTTMSDHMDHVTQAGLALVADFEARSRLARAYGGDDA